MLYADTPDVLGTITEQRAIIGNQWLHCAVGVYPQQSAIGLPLEVLTLVQNATDATLTVTVHLQLPRRDKDGNRMSFFLPRTGYQCQLPPLEVGVIHIPVVTQPPTPVKQIYPILVRVTATTANTPKVYRLIGARDVQLPQNISPYKIDVFRNIYFVAHEKEPGLLMTHFELLPEHVPFSQAYPQARYEPLWTLQSVQVERHAAKRKKSEALQYALGLSRTRVLTPLQMLVKDKFDTAGIALNPPEIQMIAKLLTYVLEDGLELEVGFDLDSAQWFERLCYLKSKEARFSQHLVKVLDNLFSAMLWDACVLGLSLISPHIDKQAGTRHEHALYANEVIEALLGYRQLTLNHVYLPFVMAGIMLNARVKLPEESPFDNLDAMDNTLTTRLAEIGSDFQEIFDVTRQLIAKARQPRL